MGKHKLMAGKEIIDSLVKLGRALGYYSQSEYPLQKHISKPQAVDVAWFRDAGQDFPLMIFEVESRSTNSAPNNPLKVFGKNNRELEKPLFFFHIFIISGVNDQEIFDLKTQYGTHNYRVYELSQGSLVELIKDIISQHRRLTNNIDLISVVKCIVESSFSDSLSLGLLEHIEGQGFNRDKGDYLSSYALLSMDYPELQKEYIRYLLTRENTSSIVPEDDEYPTYLGSWWNRPIHLGILCKVDPQREMYYIDKLKYWQEKSSYMTQIGPHFGLSQDYDEFIMWLASPLWTLIAVLMRSSHEAIGYILKQCLIIFDYLKEREPEEAIITGIWALHIASSGYFCNEYANIREWINSYGGISGKWLYIPPDYGCEEEWLEDQNEKIMIPEINVFLSLVQERITNSQPRSPVNFAIETLIDHEIQFNWSQLLIELLHG